MCGARDLGRPLDRLVEVVAVQHVVAAELLLGLRERAVGEHALAVTDAHGGGRGGGLEAVAGRRSISPASLPKAP